jgi:acyl-CoA hydrolase
VKTPVIEYLHDPAGEVAEQIARYVAPLVADGSTLQVGLGRVPNQMLAHMTNRRELAIRSDVITEPVVDLVAEGVITGPVATSWAMGTRRLHDLVDEDPRFALHPVECVCDPAVIASNERMVSVTQAFAIDLTGQVCTESPRRRALRRRVLGARLPSRRARLTHRRGHRLPCLAHTAGPVRNPSRPRSHGPSRSRGPTCTG